VAICALGALLVSGCGGESERQDADEEAGNWTVDVVEATFPSEQRLAEQSEMRVRVRNEDSKVMPNLAITVDGFQRRSEQPGLADPSRPVWVIDDAPRGGVTAYTNTWALGKLKAGEYRVKYRVAAGLDGKAKARLAGGEVPAGTFNVTVSREPSQSRVDPDSGEVIRD